MTPEDVTGLVNLWHEAFTTRDLKRYADLYAFDAVLESPLAGRVTGQEEVRRSTFAILSAFPDMLVTAEPPIVDHSRAAVSAIVSGTHAGAFLGIEATGRPFRFAVVFLLDFKNGRIIRDRRIYDFTGLLVQLGIMRARPRVK